MSDAESSAEPAFEWPSIADAPPAEQGGPVARQGFNYQDEIAVGFLIAMIEDNRLRRVHCETHDDIVLIWTAPDSEEAEYVQVKGDAHNQLWSITNLFGAKSKANADQNSDLSAGNEATVKINPSIFEKSLARDGHKERGRFRLVTLRPVSDALEALTYPCGSAGRAMVQGKISAIKAEVDDRCPGATSPKGNDAQYWLDNCYWEVANDLTSARHENMLRLFKLSSIAEVILLPEKIEVLLDELRALAKAAGDAKWIPDRTKKIVVQAQIRQWWAQRLSEASAAITGSAAEVLAIKMKEASLPSELVDLAIELRRDYAANVRTTRYMEPDRIQQLQERVKSEAMSLRAKQVGGALPLNGKQFHHQCIERMDQINAEIPNDDVSAFLKGCLYDITDRCLLRFEPPA